VDKVASFLNKVLYKNKTAFDALKKRLKAAKFDGAAFAKCDELYLEEYLKFDSYNDEDAAIKKFILHARKQLMQHQQLAQHQDSLVASVSLEGDDGGDESDQSHEADQETDEEEEAETDELQETDRRNDDEFDTSSNEEEDERTIETSVGVDIGKNITSSYQQSVYPISPNVQKRKSLPRKEHSKSFFNFSHHNLYGMALFFENELKTQSKLKLWRRIEKDMIDVIQKHELDSFLYLTMIVYVKGKYPTVRVPKYRDAHFRKSIIQPFKEWLLDFKISPPGLTLQQFNTYYASWIHEYYQLRKSDANEVSMVDLQVADVVDSLSARKARKYHHRHSPRKQHFLIPIDEAKEEEIARAEAVRLNEEKKELELESETEIDYETRTKTWNEQSVFWFRRMHEVAEFIETTLESIRSRIWDKFDKTHRCKLQSGKYLSKLVYSFIVLYAKSKQIRDAPKYKTIQPLCKYFANDIIKILPNEQRKYLTKQHFVKYIGVYFGKMVLKRSKLIN